MGAQLRIRYGCVPPRGAQSAMDRAHARGAAPLVADAELGEERQGEGGGDHRGVQRHRGGEMMTMICCDVWLTWLHCLVLQLFARCILVVSSHSHLEHPG